MAHRGASALRAIEFEVFGTVQGVFFRKYTKQTADRLGLVGFVQNTAKGTVIGEAQGKSDSIDELKLWLSKTGSPKSHIGRAEFHKERVLESLSYSEFSVRR